MIADYIAASLCNIQDSAKKHPQQKSYYFQNSLQFFGELFRGYLREILPLLLHILAFLL